MNNYWNNKWAREQAEDEARSFPHKCHVSECDNRAADDAELKFCESCGQRFCADHANEVFPQLFACDDCYKCRVCAKPAACGCEECGDYLCDQHSVEVDTTDPETGYRVSGPVCRGGCSVEIAPSEVVELQEEHLECPF